MPKSMKTNVMSHNKLTYHRRLTLALTVICGEPPPKYLVRDWISGNNPDSILLQEWAANQSPFPWLMGIGVIDAAEAMANRKVVCEGIDFQDIPK